MEIHASSRFAHTESKHLHFGDALLRSATDKPPCSHPHLLVLLFHLLQLYLHLRHHQRLAQQRENHLLPRRSPSLQQDATRLMQICYNLHRSRSCSTITSCKIFISRADFLILIVDFTNCYITFHRKSWFLHRQLLISRSAISIFIAELISPSLIVDFMIC